MVTGFDPAREAARVLSFDEDTFGIRLDYSPASLVQVDFILQTLGDDWGGIEQFEDAMLGFGCYVGEVLVRGASGRWIRSADVHSDSPCVVICGGSRFDPIATVRDRYRGLCEPLQLRFARLWRGSDSRGRAAGRDGTTRLRGDVEGAVPVC